MRLLVVTLLVGSVVVLAGYLRQPRRGGDQGLAVEAIRWSLFDAIVAVFCYQFLLALGSMIAVKIQRVGLQSERQRLVEVGGAFERWERSGLLPTVPLDPFILYLPIAVVAGITLYAGYVILVRGTWSPPRAVGITALPSGRGLLGLVLLGLSLWLPLTMVGIAWTLALQTVGVEPQAQATVEFYHAATQRGDAHLIVVLTFVAVVLAPVVEEFLFRGLLHGALRRVLGTRSPAVATALSSAAFAAIHFNVAVLLPIFCLSWVLCIIYERRGCLADSIIVHALFNAISLIALSSGEIDPRL